MSKKKQKTDKFAENEELDPEEIDSQVTESDSDEAEADGVGAEQADEEQSEILEEDKLDEESNVEDEMSPDDLLGDVRRSLILDSAEKEEAEQSKWWKRIGKGTKKSQDIAIPPAETAVNPLPIDMVEQTDEEDEYVEQIDELIDLLEDDNRDNPVNETQGVVQIIEETSPDVQPEVVDLDELKKRAFSTGKTDAGEERSLSEVRSIALDGGEEVFVEVETKVEDPMQERLKEIENALRPYRRYFYFGFIFISLVMVLVVSASLYRLWLNQQPVPVAEEVVVLPYPVQMVLPGGFKYNLGKGALLPDGRWEPTGPEWLEGTEICRWIAIPHNRQLEAIVRTFTQEDQIELIMSNNDKLVYTVYSINQLSIEDMQKLDSSSPCMLLVLAQPDEDERWVVTAKP